MAGNNLRCVAKYMYDKGYLRRETMTVEMNGAVHSLRLFLRDGRVSSVEADMGPPSLRSADVPVKLSAERAVDQAVTIGGEEYRITCVSMGNPHCVVFCENIDALDLERLGPAFEYYPLFPERV